METADVGLLGNPVYCEVSTATKKNPSSCFLREGLGLGKGKKCDSLLRVSCIRSTRPPAAMLRHVGELRTERTGARCVGEEGDGGEEC